MVIYKPSKEQLAYNKAYELARAKTFAKVRALGFEVEEIEYNDDGHLLLMNKRGQILVDQKVDGIEDVEGLVETALEVKKEQATFSRKTKRDLK